MGTPHTPGPWKFKDKVSVENEDGSNWVAIINISTFSSAANGNLISAAPEMLEALQRIRRRAYTDGFESPSELKRYLDEIIVLTTGPIDQAIQ